jgi:hypothetical protein
MTTQKSFKRRVRARMAKTGESYAAARRRLLPGVESVPEPQIAPRYSDETVRKATDKDWGEWFELLDAWGATDHKHGEIARWLNDEYGVPGWWCQTVALTYEHARGMRQVNQQHDGDFAASASKTIAVSAEALTVAFTDDELRERWLPGAEFGIRTVRPGRSLRADWAGGTRLAVSFDPKGEHKAQVAVIHEHLDGSAEAELMKSYWRERLAALKKMLEGA